MACHVCEHVVRSLFLTVPSVDLFRMPRPAGSPVKPKARVRMKTPAATIKAAQAGSKAVDPKKLKEAARTDKARNKAKTSKEATVCKTPAPKILKPRSESEEKKKPKGSSKKVSFKEASEAAPSTPEPRKRTSKVEAASPKMSLEKAEQIVNELSEEQKKKDEEAEDSSEVAPRAFVE